MTAFNQRSHESSAVQDSGRFLPLPRQWGTLEQIQVMVTGTNQPRMKQAAFMKRKKIGMGTVDFRELREGDYLFTDKSMIISETISADGMVLLFP